MKIYDIVNVPYGLGYDDGKYEEIMASGYSAGYQSGYTDGLASCGNPYERTYFTIEALEDGNMYVIPQSGMPIEYNINGTGWQDEEGLTYEIPIRSGDTIQFRFVSPNPQSAFIWSPFDLTEFRFNVYGNILSLIYGENFRDVQLDEAYALTSYLFGEWTKPVDASNLILPAVKKASYENMFDKCTLLTGAPVIQSSQLTYLNGMFKECSNLSYIKCIKGSNTVFSYGWVQGVAANGTFETNSTDTWTTGNDGIPTGWTRVDAD